MINLIWNSNMFETKVFFWYNWKHTEYFLSKRDNLYSMEIIFLIVEIAALTLYLCTLLIGICYIWSIYRNRMQPWGELIMKKLYWTLEPSTDQQRKTYKCYRPSLINLCYDNHSRKTTLIELSIKSSHYNPHWGFLTV